jgi:L-fuconolactonase
MEMRLDSHQHFWNYRPEEYGWISDGMEALKRDFLPSDLVPLLKALKFEGSVAVQARQTLEETEWLLAFSEHHPLVRGVVGWVDLTVPDLRDQLKRYVVYPAFRGVRHVLQDEPNDDHMLQSSFMMGISALEEFGLTYDLLLHPRHLPFACRLVEKFPNQFFVLDHLAKPDIKNGVLSPWKEDLRNLAQFPNVYCKLSGMVTEAEWRRWKPEDFRPYLDVALEAFGTERLMIGSDWPVCTLSAEYEEAMGIVTGYIEELSENEREKIQGENCARFYGIQRSG